LKEKKRYCTLRRTSFSHSLYLLFWAQAPECYWGPAARERANGMGKRGLEYIQIIWTDKTHNNDDDDDEDDDNDVEKNGARERLHR
jgi:hypothetical protein